MKQELIKEMVSRLEGYRLVIHQQKIKGKDDSIFYDGLIATMIKPDGKEINLIVCGEIKLKIDDKVYRNVDDAIEEHKLTDKKIKKLYKEERIEFLMNNWFEIQEDGLEETTCSYDDAIEMLKARVREKDGND